MDNKISKNKKKNYFKSFLHTTNYIKNVFDCGTPSKLKRKWEKRKRKKKELKQKQNKKKNISTQ